MELAEINQLATRLRHVQVETVLLPILIQLMLIIIVARCFAWISGYLKQPQAVGEIAAGLILGPSFLGRCFPETYSSIFQPVISDIELQPLFATTLHWIFTILSQIGLVLLLFLIGLEFDFSHLKSKGKAAAMISFFGIAAPFSLGVGLAYLIYPIVADASIPFLGFSLFVGTAMSITALPMLGRMMMEMGITNSRIGVITISAAAVNDAMGWIILATIAAFVRGQFSIHDVAFMILSSVGFAVVVLLLAAPALRKWASKNAKNFTSMTMALLLSLVFLCAIVTNVIGIFAIFGAFLLGAALSSETEFSQAVSAKLHDFVMVFFLPIFFTYTGLRTRVDAVDTPMLWAVCAAVIAVAIIGKFCGCGLAAKLSGFSNRESVCIGAMMNTRALMELVVINIGKDLGVIPDSVFTMLVLMALITTVMTTPLLLRFMKGTELEALVNTSGFHKKAI